MKQLLRHCLFMLMLITLALFVACKKDSSSGEKGVVGSSNSDQQTVSLADGNIMLEIPAGAMPEGTQVSMKSSEAEFPDMASVLNQFELLPVGTKFSKPVTLTIKYDDKLLKGNSPYNVGIAFQNDKDGKWYAPINGEVDKVNHTLSVKITHFSHWSIFSCFHLHIKTNDQVYSGNEFNPPMLTDQKADLLLIMDYPPLSLDEQEVVKLLAPVTLVKDPVNPVSTSDCPDCDILAPVTYVPPIRYDDLKPKALKPDKWMVNGIVNGNVREGTIQLKEGTYYTYTAPEKMPLDNPIAITAGVNTESNGQIQLVQQVNVYARKWRLSYRQTYGHQCGGFDDFGYGYEAEVKSAIDFVLKDGFQIESANYSLTPLMITSSASCTVCESDVRLSAVPGTGVFISNLNLDFITEKDNPFPFQIVLNADVKFFAKFNASWMENICGDDPFPVAEDVELDNYSVTDFPLGWIPDTPLKTDIRLGDPDPYISATMEAME